VAVPLIAVIGTTERERRRREEEVSAVDQQLPALIDAMIQQLRSGMGLHGLCLEPPAMGPQVDAMAHPMTAALRAGRPLVEAVRLFGATDPVARPGRLSGQGSDLVATVLTTIATHGGPAVPALQRLRLTLAGQAHGRAEARVRSSQALASARLLMLAPMSFALLLATVDDDLGRLYLQEPIGAVCVGGGIVLTYAGWRWMNRLVADVVPAVGSLTPGIGEIGR